jgi:hypothetical protein
MKYTCSSLILTVFILEICALLGNYAAYSGNSLPMFRDDLSVPFSRGKISRTLEIVTKFLKETMRLQTLLGGNDNVNRLRKQRKSNNLLCNIHACCQGVGSVEERKKYGFGD